MNKSDQAQFRKTPRVGDRCVIRSVPCEIIKSKPNRKNIQNMNKQTLERVKDVEARVSSLVNSIQNRACKLAESVEVPRCGLHNASIDDNMTGWCAGNPKRLQVAKRAVRMIDESWEVSSLGDRIVRRLFNSDESFGELKYDVSTGRAINTSLLFANI